MKVWLTAFVCASLAACAGVSRINHFDYNGYSSSTAYFAAPKGEMVLAVYGSPVADNPGDLPKAIADAMRGTHVDVQTVFVPTTEPDLMGYRTVVVFGHSTPKSVCSVKDADGMANSSPTAMTAAFCLGKEALSYVSGAVPAIATVDDPILAAHMSLVGLTLFPDENPHHTSDCGGNTPICGD
jgi:hypothetical protein